MKNRNSDPKGGENNKFEPSNDLNKSNIEKIEKGLKSNDFRHSINDFFITPPLTSQMLKSIQELNDAKSKFNSLQNKYRESTGTKIIESKISIDKDIVDLQKRLHDEKKKWQTEKGNRERVEILYKELEEKQKSSHILSRVHEDAGSKFLNSNKFKSKFDHGNEVEAVVISIDIRRSTDLMLKAKSPTEYSDFITGLSQKLSQIIIQHLGIFDKFTGDGILAFFPKFYSGDDAILLALLAAEECHKVFKEHYSYNRNKFTVHIKNVGLGIGIDYGKVSIANTPSELTVVGRPVVYACRFSGAKAGDTLLNLEALEQIEELDHPMIKDIEESEIDIKNEGIATAFKIHIDSNKFTFSEEFPWDSFQDEYTLSDAHQNVEDKTA